LLTVEWTHDPLHVKPILIVGHWTSFEISIVADVLKYLVGTLTIIMIVKIEVMNFKVCEEEKTAHVGDEGPYMWWPHLPSFN